MPGGLGGMMAKKKRIVITPIEVVSLAEPIVEPVKEEVKEVKLKKPRVKKVK